MNTERFKFRVWDKRKKRYVDCYVIGDDGWAYQLHCASEDSYDLIPNEDVVIEQCTGLKDKNGNLLYEGDVVLALESWSGRKREFNVIYCEKEYGFLFVDKYQNTKALFAFLPEELEILGNIHEMEVTK